MKSKSHKHYTCSSTDYIELNNKSYIIRKRRPTVTRGFHKKSPVYPFPVWCLDSIVLQDPDDEPYEYD